MPLFMDVHPGLGDATAEDVAAAHRRDLEMQGEYGVQFLSYWFNDPTGKTFCLVEAPDVESLRACHKAAHGLMPYDVIEVESPTLSMFMGEMNADSNDRAMLTTDEPDAGLRAIMFTDIEGSTALSTGHGDDLALEVVRRHDAIVRGCLAEFGGSEVKHTGDGVLASFVSATASVSAAASIHQRAEGDDRLRIKIGISAGEPVEDAKDLYGAAVNLAARICAHATGGQTLVANTIRDLTIGKGILFEDQGSIALKGFPDPVRLYAAG